MMRDVIIWTHTIVHLSAKGLQGECMSTVHYSYHGGLESARPLPPPSPSPPPSKLGMLKSFQYFKSFA